MDARRSNAHCLAPPGVRLLSCEGFGRIEVALSKGVDLDSEEGIEALNKFSIAVATTDVRDCFRRFRMPHSLGKFFCLRTVPAHVLSMTGEVLEGQKLEAHTDSLAMLGSFPVGFSWSLFLAQSCNEEKACLAPSLRRISGDETTLTQLIHDRGPPLVFVAGEQRHGGAYVFADNLGAICDNVALIRKMVSEWTEIFEPLGLALHKTEEPVGLVEALGTELDGRELSSRVTSKRFWILRQGLTAFLRRRRCSGRALERIIGHCTCVGLASRGT